LKGVGDSSMYTLHSPDLYSEAALRRALLAPVSTLISFTLEVSFLRTQCR